MRTRVEWTRVGGRPGWVRREEFEKWSLLEGAATL